MSGDEKLMAGTLLLTVGLWVFGGSIGIGNVAAALAGLSILLVTGIVSWKECLSKNAAWDTFVWFAALIAMAGCLSKFGFIAWFSDAVVAGLSGLGLPWQAAVSVLAVIYFYSHYMFASGAANIGAMCTAFISIVVGLVARPLVSVMELGCLTASARRCRSSTWSTNERRLVQKQHYPFLFPSRRLARARRCLVKVPSAVVSGGGNSFSEVACASRRARALGSLGLQSRMILLFIPIGLSYRHAVRPERSQP